MIIRSVFEELPRVGDIVHVGRQPYRVAGESEFVPISREQAQLLAAAQRGADTWAQLEQERRQLMVEAVEREKWQNQSIG